MECERQFDTGSGSFLTLLEDKVPSHTHTHTHGEQVEALPVLGRGISGVCVKGWARVSEVTFHQRREEGNEKDHGSYPELHSDSERLEVSVDRGRGDNDSLQ